MDPKDVIRRAWENRKAEWPKGAERYYVPAYVPLDSTWQPPSPEDWNRLVPREERVVEFRRERVVNHRDGYYSARVVGSFRGEEITVNEWIGPLSTE